MNRALVADPLSLDVRRELAFVQLCEGQYEEAIANLQQIRRADAKFPGVDLLLARALTFAGRLDEATALWASTKGPGWVFWASHAWVRAGRRAEVEEMAAAEVHPYRQAVLHTALGDKDRAFDALSRAVDILPHRVAVLLVAPETASLRGDPRFQTIRRKLNLP